MLYDFIFVYLLGMQHLLFELVIIFSLITDGQQLQQRVEFTRSPGSKGSLILPGA